MAAQRREASRHEIRSAKLFKHPASLGRDVSTQARCIIPHWQKLASPAFFLQKTQGIIYGQPHSRIAKVAKAHMKPTPFQIDNSTPHTPSSVLLLPPPPLFGILQYLIILFILHRSAKFSCASLDMPGPALFHSHP
ncbi:hypothetical protein [Mailhella sp.]